MTDNPYYTLLARSIRGGLSPQNAYKKLGELAITAEQNNLLIDALRIYEEKTGKIRNLKKPTSIKRDVLKWYLGPSDEDIFWPKLKNYLINDKKWPKDTVKLIDKASSKIISLTQPPGFAQVDTRGLVVGYVQSGKTANFTAVLAKAADVNYRFFIVLSGITNSLRSQTQKRLEQELVDFSPQNWITLTTIQDDFRPGPHRNIDAFLSDSHDQKVLCVVKKNAAVLRRLLKWLKTASKETLKACPVLVIDDEADQASLNASKYEDERTTINRLVLETLTLLPKAAYIGYTATPFANIFVDPSFPEGLYPKDFIVELPKPKQYFGPEKIFGRDLLEHDDEDPSDGLDIIRTVKEEETEFLKPTSRKFKDEFEPEITQSLAKALNYFWMATAARHDRGQETSHSTMLIHTSLYTIIQERYEPLLKKFKRNLLTDLHNGNESKIQLLKSQWEEEIQRVPASEFDIETTTFDELMPYLIEVVTDSKIVIENSISISRLSFEEEGAIQIVVGGNTLSRGLTLEGLLVSFFIRTSTAYDTLLQMGRWFGYRPGYGDLARIWMTDELRGYFYDLATVEQEIRYDIQMYGERNLTPIDFGVRVRTHPKMSITSKMKMQSAIPVEVSFEGQQPQTVLFDHKNKSWLKHNWDATNKFVKSISTHIAETTSAGDLIARNVPVQFVLDFINSYQFHPNNIVLQSHLLAGYIEAQSKKGALRNWNIIIKSRKNRSVDKQALLGSNNIGLLTRTRRRAGTNDQTAHLGALMSVGDTAIDLSGNIAELKKNSRKEIQQTRREQLPKIGALIIYPIDKNSAPANERQLKNRLPLNAVHHMIGLALVFPETDKESKTPQKYMTVKLPPQEIEEDEELEAILLDEAKKEEEND